MSARLNLGVQFGRCIMPGCALGSGHERQMEHRGPCFEPTPEGHECAYYDGHDGPHEAEWEI